MGSGRTFSSMSNLPEAQVTKARNVFAMFDRTQSDKIGARELPMALRSCGCAPSEADCQKMLKDAGAEQVDFGQFLALVGQHINAVPKREAVKRWLSIFDKEGKGMVASGELRHMMTNMAEKLSEEEA